MKNLRELLNNFLTSNQGDSKNLDEYFRTAFLNLTLLLAILIDLYLFFHLLNLKDFSILWLICLQLIAFPIVLLLLRVLKGTKFISIILLLFAMASLLWNIPSGGVEKSGLYWLPIFPLIALFLAGRTIGILLTLLMIIFAWLLIYLGEFGVVQMSFPREQLGQSVIALSAISLIAFIFESLRDSYSKRLAKETEDLAKYKVVIQEANDQIVITDPEGVVLFANPATKRMTGYTVEESLGKKAGSLWGGLMDKLYYKNMWKTIKEDKETFIGRIKNKRKDGGIYYVDIRITPVLDDNNNISFFVSIERDATQQYQVEQAKRQLDAFFELNPEIMVIANTDGYFKKINRSFPKLIGFSETEILKTPFMKFVHPDDTEVTKKELVKLSRGNKMNHFSNRFRKKDGSYIWLEWSASEEGSAIYASARDISKAKEVDQMKNEFISLASHQLKTPASGVKAYLSMLIEGDAGNLKPKQKNFAATAYAANERQIQIVEALLNVSRIESGKFQLQPTKTDVVKLVNDLSRMFSGTLENRQQKLKLMLPKKQILLDIDEQKLWMALGNLIDNASKYSRENQTITVSINDKKSRVEITIKDQGVGMKPEDQQKLFKKFSRIDNELSAKSGGTGLGLYLVDRIIRMHNGKINVDSSPGKGSAFTVILNK